MNNRITNPEGKLFQAAVEILEKGPGSIQGKMAFLLSKGLPVEMVLEAVSIVAGMPIIIAKISSTKPKQNWQWN